MIYVMRSGPASAQPDAAGVQKPVTAPGGESDPAGGILHACPALSGRMAVRRAVCVSNTDG